MKNKNGFGFDIHAKSNADSLQQMRNVKLENQKYLRGNPTNQDNTNVGNIQRLGRQKGSLNNIIASQQMKKGEANKGVQNTNFRRQPEVEASKKIIEKQLDVEACKKNVEQNKGFVKNNNIKRQLEVAASKEIAAPSKVFVQNNNTKKNLKSTVDHQVKGLIESQVSKNKGEQNKEVRQNNNLKRQVRSTMENQVQGSTVDQQPSKKKKTIPNCPAMPIAEYLNKNKEQDGVDESDDEDIEESEMEEYMETDMNYGGEEFEGADVNTTKGLIRKRGKTICRKIHTRQFKDRDEITLNGEGQPIGPDEKTVSEFSSFLGTIARSSDICPLTFTSWIGLVKSWEEQVIDPVWDYVNEKYIIPKEGRKAVLAIVNDAWKRYKCWIKRMHFSSYKTKCERLKNRPQDIPEGQFRNLLEFWEDEKTQEVSHQNAQNIAQLKYRHRTGNKAFAVIREKMRVSSEDKEPPTQAQVFIATRQSRKGKELDKETNSAIIKLQDMIENNGQPSSEAFQSIVGKEKPGRMRCHGRTTTLTLLKRNEEIEKLKREHADEVEQLKQEMEEKRRQDKEAMETKIQQEKEATERKLQILLKAIVNQNTANLDVEALQALISAPTTDAPNDNEKINNDDIEEEMKDHEEEEEES
ncbi:uncharacterized protein LOC123902122 [Trifolium pratense]|uniref:uncharacterized protein LOC123902122 n=1 Tax=Trifolium pratense TaxID=57577 RepID=UPI001E6937B7|nr:uncharacterized protein LOC123902122 [Trifolium pratense]